MDAQPKPKHHRRVNLRRNSQATVAGLRPADKITAVYDKVDGWRLEIESEDGVEIRHIKTSCRPKSLPEKD